MSDIIRQSVGRRLEVGGRKIVPPDLTRTAAPSFVGRAGLVRLGPVGTTISTDALIVGAGYMLSFDSVERFVFSVLLRPDNYIGYISPETSPDGLPGGLKAYLKDFVGHACD